MRGKEATTAGNGNGKEMKSGDEQHLHRQQMPYGMSLGSQVNMTNCVKHSHHFFHRYPSIHSDVVIAYWMMAGYLGPARDFHEAYGKGWDIWRLRRASECNHEGFCVLHNLAFFHLLNFDFSDRTAGIKKYGNIHKLELKRMTYLVDYKLTPESFKEIFYRRRHVPLKAQLDNNLNAEDQLALNALLIRGYEFLSSAGIGNGIFPDSTNVNSLTVVEISSSPCSPIDIGFISELTHLKVLNLSHLPDLEMLPHNLFYKLRHLCWLIVRGCSKLRSLPSIDGLTKLVVLDLSHCTNLQQPVFIDIRYPHLQMLDVSYTPLFCGFWELLTPKLTHLSLRGSKLKNLLVFNKLDNLQVLDLSGCEKLVNLSPFINVPSLKHLNLCGCTSFMNFHEDLFDQMSGLEDLDLSWTKVKHLPSLICLTSLRKLSLRGVELDSLEAMAASLPSQLLHLDLTSIKDSSSHELKLDFLQSLEKLEILNLSGSSVEKLPDLCKLVSLEKLLLVNCPQLKVVPNLSESLKILNLSNSSVEKLPDMSKLVRLEKLLLADCEHLKVVPDLNANQRLKELDLSGLQICSMEDFNLDFLQSLYSLEILNLSRSSVEKLPDMSKLVRLEKLLLADCEHLKVVPDLNANQRLKELDLSGLQICSMEDFNLDFLQSLYYLEILNLSRSSVEKLPDMSKLRSLEQLLLADCPQLKVVPNLRSLYNLKTLDLSLPNDSSVESRQLEFVTPTQWFPFPWSLQNLVLRNRSGIHKFFPNERLQNLKFLDLRGSDVADCDSILEAPKAKATEIHALFVPKSIQPSQDDHFDDLPVDLDALISDIQNQFNSTDHQVFKTQLEKLHGDLRYIRLNMDGLKSSINWKSGKDLLLELMDAATDPSLAHFSVNSATLKLLSQLVVKLKLLVPPTPHQEDDSEALHINQKKKKKSSLMRSKNKENTVLANFAIGMPEMMADLLTCYHSLSDIQKECLLCFSIFPYNEVDEKYTCVLKSLLVRRKILTYWWVGEGFIDPHQVESVDPNQSTVEEIGKQILKVLVEKHFIQPVVRKGQESASYYMTPFVHYFVIQRAKEERFFDIDQETGNLAPHFHLSQRACLLKPHDKFPSSCHLWARHVDSPKKQLASFEHVKTLFNVNDSMVDIKREWFSKMKNLCVLHLGSWGSENADLVEVEDQKFLEDLNRLKQLRLLSLQGLPTIMKLPDSVCELNNLIILDLKECSYLEELPADIGSLKSLTHLDITNCPLLTKLPKGISLLSKLQVLRGFIITDQYYASHASKDRNASILHRLLEKNKWCSTIQKLFHSRNNDVCTLRDLLKLERLRVLSLVVNISMFPRDEELRVFREMKQLRKLKIVWERNIYIEDNVNGATEQGTLTEPSGWKTNLKCCECQQSQIDGDDTDENKHLDNLEKLELWCFPHENTPEWLNPSELKKLEKLYFVGGHLTKLRGPDIDENPWNVKTLRLKHLHKLDIQWDALKNMFPQLTYLEKHQCAQLATFPCDQEGVWKSAN